MKRILVGVVPAAEHEQNRRLFDALESLLPVSFSTEGLERAEACLLLAGGRESAVVAAQRGIPCYAVVSPVTGTETAGETWVQFGNSSALTPCLRGRRLPELECCRFSPISCEPGDEVLAAGNGQPLWVHRTFERGRGAMDLVAVAPPVLTEGEYPANFFCRERFLRLLPLIHFLRRITEGHRWEPAPRRACLVFDDPTLPSPSYGCLNFSKLAAHAREWNYHAVIATIPLSGRRVSPENAALFRESAAHLSLVIHGNDHIWQEMARVYSEAERVAILAQAWQRIVDMEQRHRISVGRIMEAPYGVIDQAMIEPLVKLGYEATLITPLQFLRYNCAASFPPAIGLGTIECLAGGLCLLPRIKLTRYWQTEVLLAVLLDQPIIVVGHHYDAADGLELMKDMARTINELGQVCWMNLVEIARSQYQLRRDAETLRVRLGSRRVALPVPEGVRTLVIERPWMFNGESEPLIVRSSAHPLSETRTGAGVVESVAMRGAGAVEIVSPVVHPVNPAAVPPRRRQVWPLVRRALMESRDRAYPYLRRTAGNTRAEGASTTGRDT